MFKLKRRVQPSVSAEYCFVQPRSASLQKKNRASCSGEVIAALCPVARLSDARNSGAGLKLLAGSSVISIAIISSLTPAFASMAGSDAGMSIVSAGPASRRGSDGGLGASASSNSIALVGDGDCGRLTSGPFSVDGIYGTGVDHTGGIYGFGSQESPLSYNGLYNAGKGMSGWKVWNSGNSYTNGNVSQSSHSKGTDRAMTEAYGANSTAIGCDAKAFGWGANAFGWGANANGAGALALGVYANAGGQGSIAFGIGANAAAEDTIAWGSLAKASQNGAIAIGALTQATGRNTVAIGAGDGTEGSGAAAISDGAVAIGSGSEAGGAANIAIGNHAQATGWNGAIAIGSSSFAEGTGAIAIGSSGTFAAATIAKGVDSLALGNGARTDAQAGTALGVGANAQGSFSAAIGQSVAQGSNSVAIGNQANAGYDNSVALGAASETGLTAPTGVGFATGAAAPTSVVSVGNSKIQRRITNVSAGAAATDAVNVSQLEAVSGNTSGYLGGGADVAAGKAPSYTIQGTTYNDAGSAFDGVDTNIAGIRGDISTITNNIDNGSLGPVRRSGDDALTLVARGGDVANPGAAQTLKNVKGGNLSADSVDAVNGSQLFATNTNVTALADNVAQVSKDVTRVSGNTSGYLGGGADVAAGKAPSYTIQGTTYNDAGSAFDGVDTNIAGIRGDISTITNNIDNGSLGPVRRSGDDALTLVARGGDVANPGAAQTLKNVKGGNLSADSVDAVNGSQLFATNTSLNNLNDRAIVYDGAVGGGKDKITFAGESGTVLSNVKAGAVSAASIDAVNGSQLYGMSDSVAKHLGGGATVNGDGTINGPEYIVAGNKYKTVYDAFGAVSEDFYNIANDALSWDENKNAFSAIHKDKNTGEKTKSKLIDLLDGEIAENSSDAVTGSQLNITNTSVANYLGGGADYTNGVWTGPTYKLASIDAGGRLSSKSYNTVGDALGSLGDSVSNVNNRVNDLDKKVDDIAENAQGDALKWNDKESAFDAAGKGNKSNRIVNVADGEIAQGSKDAVNGGQLWDTNKRIDGIEGAVGDVAKNSITYDKDSDGNKTNRVTLQGGDSSKPVTITNVADGKIERGSKDAVNGGQLHDYTQEKMAAAVDESKRYTDTRVNGIISDANGYTDMRFGQLNHEIGEVRTEARQAAAIGLAASSLRFDDRPGKLSVAVGSGFWKGEGAFAFGAGYTSDSGRVRGNITGTSAGGSLGVGAGVSFTLN